MTLHGDAVVSHELRGRTIVVTRGGLAGDLLVRRLESMGASVVHCPTIAFTLPEDLAGFQQSIANVMNHDWLVFTSANAVQAVAQQLFERFSSYELPLPAIAAVGPATAAAAESLGWSVQFIPSMGSGASLGEELPLKVGTRVFLPRADIASDELPTVLRNRGFVVSETIAYRTLTNPSIANSELLTNAKVDAVTFTSPSTVSGFVNAAREVGWSLADAQKNRTVVVCIGETTAAAVRAYDLSADAIAVQPTMDALIDALLVSFDVLNPANAQGNAHNTTRLNSPSSGSS